MRRKTQVWAYACAWLVSIAVIFAAGIITWGSIFTAFSKGVTEARLEYEESKPDTRVIPTSPSSKTPQVTPEPYTPFSVDEAMALAEELWIKFVDVRSFYLNDGLPVDYEEEPLMVGDVEFRTVQGDIRSIDAIKAITETVLTQEYASKFYESAFGGDIPLYIERDGILFETYTAGIGWPEEWHFDTLEIREQTENTLLIAAEQYIWTTEETLVKEISLVKTTDGWRIDSIEY